MNVPGDQPEIAGRRVIPATFLAASMSLPPMLRQLQFRKVTEKLRTAETELSQIETALAALLPSALAQVFGGGHGTGCHRNGRDTRHRTGDSHCAQEHGLHRHRQLHE